MKTKIRNFLKDIFSPRIYIHYHGIKPFGKKASQLEASKIFEVQERVFKEQGKMFKEMEKLFEQMSKS